MDCEWDLKYSSPTTSRGDDGGIHTSALEKFCTSHGDLLQALLQHPLCPILLPVLHVIDPS